MAWGTGRGGLVFDAADGLTDFGVRRIINQTLYLELFKPMTTTMND